MVRPANKPAKVPVRFSSSNFAAYSSSTKLHMKRYSGLYFLTISSVAFKFFARYFYRSVLPG